MASEAKQFHCPNCLADLKFSPTGQNFVCEYCKSTFTEAQVMEVQRKYMDLESYYQDDIGQMPPEMQMDDR